METKLVRGLLSTLWSPVGSKDINGLWQMLSNGLTGMIAESSLSLSSTTMTTSCLLVRLIH